jgi:DNA uptake protein ComE-like DNA-binding protein
LVIDNPSRRKLNLNRLSLNELKRHPYINYYQAKAITDYRRLRGSLHSLQELRLLPDFPPEAVSRLEPYVEF